MGCSAKEPAGVTGSGLGASPAEPARSGVGGSDPLESSAVAPSSLESGSPEVDGLGREPVEVHSVESTSVGWLRGFVERSGGVAGTIHELEADHLELRAALRIPLDVQRVTRRIPRGKGMAGLAWERGVPVQTCNLQADASGDVRPGARAVKARGAVALPVRAESGEVIAVVGVAFADERDLGETELLALAEDARGCLALG